MHIPSSFHRVIIAVWLGSLHDETTRGCLIALIVPIILPLPDYINRPTHPSSWRCISSSSHSVLVVVLDPCGKRWAAVAWLRRSSQSHLRCVPSISHCVFIALIAVLETGQLAASWLHWPSQSLLWCLPSTFCCFLVKVSVAVQGLTLPFTYVGRPRPSFHCVLAAVFDPCWAEQLAPGHSHLYGGSRAIGLFFAKLLPSQTLKRDASSKSI